MRRKTQASEAHLHQSPRCVCGKSQSYVVEKTDEAIGVARQSLRT